MRQPERRRPSLPLLYKGHPRPQFVDLGLLLLRRHKVALLSAVREPQARSTPGDDRRADAGAVQRLQVLVGSFVTPSVLAISLATQVSGDDGAWG